MTTAAELPKEKPAVASSLGRSPPLWQRMDNTRARNAGRGAVALLDQAVFSGTSFVTYWIIGHLSSKEQLGLYGLAMTVVMLVRNLEEQMIAIPYRVYSHRDRPRELASYTASVFVHQLCLSLVGMLVLPIWLAFMGAGLSWPAILCVVMATPCLLSREAVRFIAFAKVKVVSALVFDLVVCALQVLSLVALGGTHRLTVSAAYLTVGISCALATGGWLLRQRSEFCLCPARLWPDWRRNWVLAKWALVATSAGVVYPLVAPWVLQAWHKEAVGLFVAGLSLAGIPQMIIMGVSNWAGPQAARAYTVGGLKSMNKVLAATFAVYMVLIGGFAMASVLAGDWIMVNVWGNDFAGSGQVLAILALAMVAHAISNVAAGGLWAMELPRAHAKADWGMLFATVLAALFLVGPLGALGAAWATFVGAMVSAVVRTGSLWLHMAQVKTAPAGGCP